MNLNQIFIALERLGYDRFAILGNPLGVNLKCELFKPGRVEPTVSAWGSTYKQSLENATRSARGDRDCAEARPI